MSASETECNGEVLWIRDGERQSDQDDVWDDSALIDAYDKAVGQVKEEIERRKEGENSKSDVRKKTQNRKKEKAGWKVGDFCNTLFPDDGAPYEAYIKEISESGSQCLVQYLGYGNELVVPLSSLKASKGKEARELQESESQKDGTVFATVSPNNAQMDWDQNSSQSNRKPKSPHSTPSSSLQRGANQKRTSSRQSDPSESLAPPQPHSFGPQGRCFQPHPFPPSHSHHTSPTNVWAGASSCHVNPSRMYMPPIPPPPAFPLDQDAVNDEEALAAMLMSWYMSGYHTGYYQGLRQSSSSSHHSQPSCRTYQPSCSCCMHTPR